jgi:hypothetical protein
VQVEAADTAVKTDLSSIIDDALGAMNGIATLDGTTRVSQPPAISTGTPTALSIPISDGSGNLAAGWGGAASSLATLDGSSLVVENPASADATATANTIPIRDSNGDVIVPATPTALAGATSKQYVDNLAVEGRSWKELLLAPEQLEPGPSGGINQAFLAAIAVDLAVGDTFIITDGSTTETFIGVGGGPAAFDFIAGTGIAATTANLVAAINIDSTLWGAVVTTGLDNYFSSPLDPSFVVHRSTPTTADDRAYGVIANAQSDVQIVRYGGILDYAAANGTQVAFSATDPAIQYAGMGRLFAALTVGETHRTIENNAAYTWDSDDEVWQQTSTPEADNPAKGSAPYAASAPDYAEANALLPSVGDFGYFLKGATDTVFHFFRRSVVASTLTDFGIVEMT